MLGLKTLIFLNTIHAVYINVHKNGSLDIYQLKICERPINYTLLQWVSIKLGDVSLSFLWESCCNLFVLRYCNLTIDMAVIFENSTTTSIISTYILLKMICKLSA